MEGLVIDLEEDIAGLDLDAIADQDLLDHAADPGLELDHARPLRAGR
jgi:hypothetical protein